MILVIAIVAFMDGGSSWDSYISHFWSDNVVTEPVSVEPVSEASVVSDGNVVCMDSILPDDILERILSFLPIVSIFRAGSVCKRWCEIVRSRRFLWSNTSPHKPWYFMFTYNDSPEGFAYDPILRKWHRLFLPCIRKSQWFVAASCGLVCFMDNDRQSRIFVCNPITRNQKRIPEPPGVKFPEYSTLSLSVNRGSHNYTLAVANSKNAEDDFLQWEFSIHIYESESESWATPVKEVLMGWRGGEESVICNGVFYILIHSTGPLGNSGLRHGLIMYDLSSRSSYTTLLSSSIPVPCSLTCGRLMNVKDRLVMVGGIAKYDRSDIIKGICIWELNKKEWREIARMPHRFFQGFGEFDDVFASGGADNLVYIQSYGGPALLVFDINQKQWKWSQKCPVAKRFPLHLFTGFCFEPSLEAAS